MSLEDFIQEWRAANVVQLSLEVIDKLFAIAVAAKATIGEDPHLISRIALRAAIEDLETHLDE